MATRASRLLALVDSPDGRRKLQARAVPLGGGLAVMLAVAVSMALAIFALHFELGKEWAPFFRGFLPAALVLLVVGFVDDFIGMTGIYKLLGQFVAATFLAVGGVRFESISVMGPEINLGDFSILFAIFFCLGAINAFNLIDGSDAIASSVGAVVCFTVGILAYSMGGVAPAALSFATGGALLGFLAYNKPPARIYLGDTGSMMIGLTIAYASIACSVKQPTTIAIAVPIALCALPMMDAGAAFLRRILTGQSIFNPDRGHFHHSLLLRGFSAGQTAAIAAGLTACCCAGALAAHFLGLELLAGLVVLVVFAVLASFRVFGHAEVHLVLNQARHRSRSLWDRMRRNASEEALDQSAVHLQGDREWSLLWRGVCEAAPTYNVCKMRLTVSIPGIHENYYATWSNPSRACKMEDGLWKLTVPLMYEATKVGQVDVQGIPDDASYQSIQAFLDYLEPLNDQVAEILNPPTPVSVPELVST